MSRERFIRRASIGTLALRSFAAGVAARIACLGPVRHPLDLALASAMCGVFIDLLSAMVRSPYRVGGIMRTA